MKIVCGSGFPEVSTRLWSKNHERRGCDRCKICGCDIDWTNETEWQSVPLQCIECDVHVHYKCYEKLGLDANPWADLECSRITRNLRPGAVELPKLHDLHEKNCDICLVCGEKEDTEDVVVCREDCGCWVHQMCHGVVIDDLNGESVGPRKRRNFTCKEITMNIKRVDIKRYIKHKQKYKRKIVSTLVSAERVKKSGIGRKRRYTLSSENYRCQFCNEEVGINDLFHELENCKGFLSDPVFGGRLAYTPTKRARLVEYTYKRMRLGNKQNYPP